MGNTGYKFFTKLELYYTDDNSSAGEIKDNLISDVDYIAPILDTRFCPPSPRYYSTLSTLDKIKECPNGQKGSTVTLTAYPNMFLSNSSLIDANAKRDSWLAENAQVYANLSGTCSF
ncbi:DUF5977 domain-containing protein [Flavobacterium sp. AJR]|jgi:hypothetical protein|uniref:DUF5977 domain-containing protein n=1 Tax=Flavobacterium sp. AJR TaxID=1979369 RepID=UPI000A3D85E7|nr:DUF5977 domain-containing protein [Flavobacterium sp. AJR]OUL63700.1 hypothetical protein B8T70_03670 [Flavobacterium sp. AJR]